MFRLYLVNLIKSQQNTESSKKYELPRSHYDRRIYNRFEADHKHLTMMNEQDIFLVRNVSLRGFSTEVSDRSFERLKIGEQYHCKMRYLREIIKCDAEVRWKKDNFIGFMLMKPDAQTSNFMKRLIKPMDIGSSLERVSDLDSSTINEKDFFGTMDYINITYIFGMKTIPKLLPGFFIIQKILHHGVLQMAYKPES